MDYRDEQGFLVDVTLDGGDSAHFAGLSGMFGNLEPLEKYEISPGTLVRHPTDYPYNNPRNFTVDQLDPFVAACSSQGRHDIVRRVFWKTLKRGFFMQNFERDVPGSTKYPWPHSFHKDSDSNKEMEHRYFDFADPLGPADIWHLILCGRMWYLYWFGLIGYPTLFLSIAIHCLFNKSFDEGQVISKAVIGGKFFVHLYKILKSKWAGHLFIFWAWNRDMPQMYELIQKGLSKNEILLPKVQVM